MSRFLFDPDHSPTVHRAGRTAGRGYRRSVPVERFSREAWLFRIHEGTSEIRKLTVVRRLLADVAG